MIILGIDTATEMVSAAVVDGHDVLAASEARSERRHAEDLAPMIEFVVKRADLTFDELGAIAVNIGPGLFTGMRVGIASAQAMAHVLSVPLVGVDGLAALVAASLVVHEATHQIVVPTIDARRGEVAWAIHRINEDGSTTRVTNPRVGGLEDLLIAVRDRAQPCRFVGEYSVRHRAEILETIGPQSWTVSIDANVPLYPHATQVAMLGHDKLMREDALVDAQVFGDPESSLQVAHPEANAPSLAAMYLREADAEINWVTRGGS